MTTLPEFVKQHSITAKTEPIDDHPSIDWSENWQKTANHWRVTLQRKYTEVYTYHRDVNGHPETFNGHADKTRRMTVVFHTGTGIKGKPSAVDVLSSLLSDSSGIDQPFEDWAGDLGYDSDSRTAERTYKACQRQDRRLRQFLGDLYETALYEVEAY